MPGLLGTPTLAKMSVDAVGRLWRRLKEGKKQAPEHASEQVSEQASEQASEHASEQASEQDLHAFYSDSSESSEYSDGYLDPFDGFETVQRWVNGTSDTYDFFGAWRHPSEPSSLASFDGEVDLFCGVSVRGDLAQPVDAVEPVEAAVEPIVPILPIKPAKRGIKDVFNSVKAAFKQRNTSG